MTPMFQDMFYDPAAPVDMQRGNCLSACVASLLDLPLTDVPNFVQIDVNGGKHWWLHLIEWLGDKGLRISYVTHPALGLYMASGPSPRAADIHHITVYEDGELLHDPHPDGTGVVEVGSCYTILPTHEVPA